MIIEFPERTDDQLFNDCMINYLHEMDHHLRRIIYGDIISEDPNNFEIFDACFEPWLERVKTK